MKNLFYIFVLLIICNSCTKEPTHQQITKCFQNEDWDSLQVVNHLVGKWEWVQFTCVEHFDDEKSKGVTLEFREDGTGYAPNEVGKEDFTWYIEISSSNEFLIKADPRPSEIHGRIQFCDEYLEFNSSYRDGCDDFFKRKE